MTIISTNPELSEPEIISYFFKKIRELKIFDNTCSLHQLSQKIDFVEKTTKHYLKVLPSYENSNKLPPLELINHLEKWFEPEDFKRIIEVKNEQLKYKKTFSGSMFQDKIRPHKEEKRKTVTLANGDKAIVKKTTNDFKNILIVYYQGRIRVYDPISKELAPEATASQVKNHRL